MHRTRVHEHIGRKTLAQKYVDGLEREKELEKVKFMNDTTSPRSAAAAEGREMTKKEMKKMKKQEKKDKKKEKKERKKEKKKAKKEKKRAVELEAGAESGGNRNGSKRQRIDSDSE